RKALQISPTYSWTYREMARHLSAAGRHQDAITASAAHAGLSPGNRATFLVGRALARGGYDRQALDNMKGIMRTGDLTEAELVEAARVMQRVSGFAPTRSYFEQVEQQRDRDVTLFLAHVRFLVEDGGWYPSSAAK